MSDPRDFTIGAVRKDRREELRVRVRTFPHGRLVDCRLFQSDGHGWGHTPKGWAVAADQLPELIALLQAAQRHLATPSRPPIGPSARNAE